MSWAIAGDWLAGVARYGSLTGMAISLPVALTIGRGTFSTLKLPLLIFLRPDQLARIGAEGGDEAVTLA
jgi:hypothetical protein